MELKRFFRGTLDPGKIDSMFETLDDDGSGEISRDEWRKGYFSAGFGDTTVVGQSSAGLSVLLSLVSKPKKVDFMDLSHHKNGCRINKIAERGITLLQLRDVGRMFLCVVSPRVGWALTANYSLRARQRSTKSCATS